MTSFSWTAFGEEGTVDREKEEGSDEHRETNSTERTERWCGTERQKSEGKIER
jgi:hypothetical protein